MSDGDGSAKMKPIVVGLTDVDDGVANSNFKNIPVSDDVPSEETKFQRAQDVPASNQFSKE